MTKVVIDEQTVGNFKLVTELEDGKVAHITVTDLTSGESKVRTVNCFYQTTFGLDIDDMTTILNTAEEMCVEFEDANASKD